MTTDDRQAVTGIKEARLLRGHLVSVCDAITRTRHEIADLMQEQDASRARDELRAVVQGTEQATNAILTASEAVDALANGIAKRSDDVTIQADARAIQAEMQCLFEACNFQDLTGQRISKVVKTIVLVEERIQDLLQLWFGPGDPPLPFRSIVARRDLQDTLLNGPVLPGDASVSQDTVDAMFS